MHENPSRREFLKTAIAGGAFLAEVIASKEARAELEEILKTRELIKETFEQGLQRLQKEVYENKKERFFVFVKKGGKEGWINIEAAATEDSGMSINLLPLLTDAVLEEMHFVHTHPLDIVAKDYHLTPSEISAARMKHESPFPLLPSSADLETVVWQKAFLAGRRSKVKLTNSVLDPAGIWTYDADLSHPKMKPLERGAQERIARIGKKPTEEELMTADSGEGALIVLNSLLQEQQDKFYKAKGPSMTLDLIGRLKKWAKVEWGITLDFTPYAGQKPHDQSKERQ